MGGTALQSSLRNHDTNSEAAPSILLATDAQPPIALEPYVPAVDLPKSYMPLDFLYINDVQGRLRFIVSNHISRSHDGFGDQTSKAQEGPRSGRSGFNGLDHMR